jgi:limonene-1,2-epoxide hydrolase
MPTSTDIVLRFIERWHDPAQLEPAIRETFTDATVYENVGMSRTVGAQAAIDWCAAYGREIGLARIEADNLAVAETADGSCVLTERVDRMIGADGAPILTLRVMGVFELENGRITAWRDYFDTAGALASAGAAA